MKRKVYASLLVMGLACMAVTLLISTWFFGTLRNAKFSRNWK